MITATALAVFGPGGPFGVTTIERRDLGASDVLIDISYTGVCHTDSQHVNNPASVFPLVPGHEIAGVVSAVGQQASRFRVGDRVGVGCMVDSCRDCDQCRAGFEQYCRKGYVRTYAGVGRDGERTQGGYSEKIVVDEDFVVRVPEGLPLENAAPLMCAGITMYSPLKRWDAGPGSRVAILGFGGLGHVAVQVAKALGAHTAALDITADKQDDALRLGADAFHVVDSAEACAQLEEAFDLIVSTVPSHVDFSPYLRMLAMDGTLVHVGASMQPLQIAAADLRGNRRSIAGSRIGGMAETQEMMNFCADHDIRAEVEMIAANEIDGAFERMHTGDVRFRFVVDIATLNKAALLSETALRRSRR